jgi:hypothetical protein
MIDYPAWLDLIKSLVEWYLSGGATMARHDAAPHAQHCVDADVTYPLEYFCE